MLDTRIDAQTARFAVFGESLGHTWSPFIHNSIFLATRRNAVYLPITVPRDRLPDAVSVLRSCFSGFNVTIPYKEQIIPLLDEVDERARVCGAVNTVENRNGRLIGHITDGLGIISALERQHIQTQRANALVLGGGGAARVAGFEFLARGGSVTFAVRDIAKGQKLADELACTQPDGCARIHVVPIGHIAGQFDVLLNCTPVGMYPKADACPVGKEVVARCAAVFDAVYNPRDTLLLQTARALCIPTAEGFDMLFSQAMEAQRFWFGDVAPAQVQQTVYRELVSMLA